MLICAHPTAGIVGKPRANIRQCGVVPIGVVLLP
jgi:hypothetical protein